VKVSSDVFLHIDKDEQFTPAIVTWIINIIFSSTVIISVYMMYRGYIILNDLTLRFFFYLEGLSFVFGGVSLFFYSLFMLKWNPLYFILLKKNHLLIYNIMSIIGRIAIGLLVLPFIYISLQILQPMFSIDRFPIFHLTNIQNSFYNLNAFLFNNFLFFLGFFIILFITITAYTILYIITVDNPLTYQNRSYFRNFFYNLDKTQQTLRIFLFVVILILGPILLYYLNEKVRVVPTRIGTSVGITHYSWLILKEIGGILSYFDSNFYLSLLLITVLLIIAFLLAFIISLITEKPLIFSKTITANHLIMPTSKIYVEDIKYIEVEPVKQFIISSLFPSYQIMVLSLSSKFAFKVRNFNNKHKLVETFLSIENQKDEVFLKFYYYRGRGNLFKKLFADPSGIFGTLIVLIVVFIYLWGALAQFLFPVENIVRGEFLFLHQPEYQYLQDPQFTGAGVDRSPDSMFWLGTDFVGRDYFSRLVYGTFFTLNICLMVALLSTVIGSILGAIAGFSDGVVDQILVTLSDMLIAFPHFAIWVIAVSFAGYLRFLIGGFYLQTFLIMVLFVWAAPFRIVRSEVKSLKKQEYVDAVRVYGASNIRLLFTHIFPNLIPIILVIFITQMVEFLAATITISIFVPSESDIIWGSDVSRRLMVDFYEPDLYDFYLFFATIWFFVVIFGLLMFADAIKDVLDPRYSNRKINTYDEKEEIFNIYTKISGEESDKQKFVENILKNLNKEQEVK
jgi:peptide/nickel transport system permease protein